MEAHHYDTIVDSTIKMIDEERCTIQLRDDQNLNPSNQPVIKIYIEFNNLSYTIHSNKGKYFHFYCLQRKWNSYTIREKRRIYYR